MNISQEDYYFLISHGVIPTEEQTKYKCTYCNCPIYSLHNAKQHVQGYLHNFVYTEKQSQLKKSNINRDAKSESETQKLSKKNFCDICKISLINYDEHVDGKLHKEKVEQVMNEQAVIEEEKKDEVKKLCIHVCGICNLHVENATNWQQHLKGKKHVANVILVENIIFNLKKLKEYIQMYNKNTKLIDILKRVKKWDNMGEPTTFFTICPICDLEFKYIAGFIKHLQSKDHIENIKVCLINLEDTKIAAQKQKSENNVQNDRNLDDHISEMKEDEKEIVDEQVQFSLTLNNQQELCHESETIENTKQENSDSLDKNKSKVVEWAKLIDMHNQIHNNDQITTINNQDNNEFTVYFYACCKLCNIVLFDKEKWKVHLLGENHKKQVKSDNTLFDDQQKIQQYQNWANLDYVFNDETVFVYHDPNMFSKETNNLIESELTKNEKKPCDSIFLSSDEIPESWEDLLDGREEEVRVKIQDPHEKETVSTNSCTCKSCNVNFDNDQSLFRHFKEHIHKSILSEENHSYLHYDGTLSKIKQAESYHQNAKCDDIKEEITSTDQVINSLSSKLQTEDLETNQKDLEQKLENNDNGTENNKEEAEYIKEEAEINEEEAEYIKEEAEINEEEAKCNEEEAETNEEEAETNEEEAECNEEEAETNEEEAECNEEAEVITIEEEINKEVEILDIKEEVTSTQPNHEIEIKIIYQNTNVQTENNSSDRTSLSLSSEPEIAGMQHSTKYFDFSESTSNVSHTTSTEDVKIKPHIRKRTLRKPVKPSNKKPEKEFNYFDLFLSEESIFHCNLRNENELRKSMSLTFLQNVLMQCTICSTQFSYSAQDLYEHVRSSEHRQLFEQLKKNDKEFADYPEQFSDLKLAESLIMDLTDDELTCFACNKNLQNNDEQIHLHISNLEHIKNYAEKYGKVQQLANEVFQNCQDCWYKMDRFWCQLCGEMFVKEEKFYLHLASKNHQQKCQNSFGYDCCMPCSYLWFGHENTYEEHVQSASHEYNLKSGKFEVEPLPLKARKSMNNFNDLLEMMFKCSEEDQCSSVIKKVMANLKCDLKPKFPLIQMHSFESSLTETALVDEPVGILIYTGDENESNIQTKKHNWKTITNVLNQSQFWDIIKIQNQNLSMKMLSTHFGIKCNILLGEKKSIEKSKALRLFINTCKPCKLMILYLQNWLTFCNFDPEVISSYAISWLVVFYLQLNDLLPSVFDVVINQKLPDSSLKVSLFNLLKGFFKFYATFDYKTQAIFPYWGKILKKRNLFDANSKDFHQNVYCPFILKDPVTDSKFHNVTKNVTKLHLRTFRHYCTESEKYFSLNV